MAPKRKNISRSPRMSRLLYAAFHPRYWRVRTRRLFLVTAPIAIPMWLIAISLLVVATFLQPVFEALATLWSAKPKRRYRYTDLGYGKTPPAPLGDDEHMRLRRQA